MRDALESILSDVFEINAAAGRWRTEGKFLQLRADGRILDVLLIKDEPGAVQGLGIHYQ